MTHEQLTHMLDKMEKAIVAAKLEIIKMETLIVVINASIAERAKIKKGG